MPFRLCNHHLNQYRAAGYLLLRSHFTHGEIDLLRSTAKTDKQLHDHAFKKLDGDGNPIRLSVWNHPEENLYGIFSRCDRVVGVAEQLLEDEPYHYHSKMILKDSLAGGSWEWHQDYGYWYYDDPPFPQMISALLAVTDADKSNGCLRVLKGSHRCGRIEHGRTGGQVAADTERVQALIQRLQVVEGELAAGSVLFFHCNLLHSSAANLSARSRISYICCYNALSNPPLTKRGHGPCEPIELGRDNLDGWG